jgi:putative endopeptidase
MVASSMSTATCENWWMPEDSARFEVAAQCFRDEYSQFVLVDDKRLNGQLTLGENLADNGGLPLAYAALERTPEDFVGGLRPRCTLG